MNAGSASLGRLTHHLAGLRARALLPRWAEMMALAALLLLVLSAAAAWHWQQQSRRWEAQASALTLRAQQAQQAAPQATAAGAPSPPAEAPARPRSPSERLAELLDRAVEAGLQLDRLQSRGADGAQLVVMPAHADYRSLRRFVADALASDPQLVLASLRARRESAAVGQLQIELQWTWPADAATSAERGRR